jgi:hypothetical protein
VAHEEWTLCGEGRCCDMALPAKCEKCGRPVFHHGNEPQAKKICPPCAREVMRTQPVIIGNIWPVARA